jgi:hypothetical protein
MIADLWFYVNVVFAAMVVLWMLMVVNSITGDPRTRRGIRRGRR